MPASSEADLAELEAILVSMIIRYVTGEPPGIRTRNQGIKSPLLYR